MERDKSLGLVRESVRGTRVMRWRWVFEDVVVIPESGSKRVESRESSLYISKAPRASSMALYIVGMHSRTSVKRPESSFETAPPRHDKRQTRLHVKSSSCVFSISPSYNPFSSNVDRTLRAHPHRPQYRRSRSRCRYRPPITSFCTS
jgi:hypothetical protein